MIWDTVKCWIPHVSDEAFQCKKNPNLNAICVIKLPMHSPLLWWCAVRHVIVHVRAEIQIMIMSTYYYACYCAYLNLTTLLPCLMVGWWPNANYIPMTPQPEGRCCKGHLLPSFLAIEKPLTCSWRPWRTDRLEVFLKGLQGAHAQCHLPVRLAHWLGDKCPLLQHKQVRKKLEVFTLIPVWVHFASQGDRLIYECNMNMNLLYCQYIYETKLIV